MSHLSDLTSLQVDESRRKTAHHPTPDCPAIHGSHKNTSSHAVMLHIYSTPVALSGPLTPESQATVGSSKDCSAPCLREPVAQGCLPGNQS